MSAFPRLAYYDALRHPVRARVLAEFRTRETATAGEVARAMGLDHKTVIHHASVLAKFGHLVRDASPGRGRYAYRAFSAAVAEAAGSTGKEP